VIGTAKPSREDRRLTRHLSRIGAALKVNVIDHLIINMSTRDVYSFADANEVRERKRRARSEREFDRAIALGLRRTAADTNPMRKRIGEGGAGRVRSVDDALSPG
jgi:hypothetical protein